MAFTKEYLERKRKSDEQIRKGREEAKRKGIPSKYERMYHPNKAEEQADDNSPSFVDKALEWIKGNPTDNSFLGSTSDELVASEAAKKEEIQEAKALQTGDDTVTEKRAPVLEDVTAPWEVPEEEPALAPSVEEDKRDVEVTPTIRSLEDVFKASISRPEAPKRSGELELVDAEGKPVVQKYGNLVEANKQLNKWIFSQVGAIDKKEQAGINSAVARLDNKFAAYKQKIASLTGQADRESKNLAMGMLLEGIVDGLGMIAVAATTKGRAEYSKGKGVNWDMLNAQIDKRMKNQMAVLDAQFNFDQNVVKDEILQAKYNAKAERDRVAMMAGGAQRQISTQERDIADKEAKLQKYKEMWFGVQKEDQLRKEAAAKENRAFELQEKEQRLKYADKEEERKAKAQRQQLAIDAKSLEGTKNRALKERMQRTAQAFEAVQSELNRMNKIDLTTMNIESRREFQQERMKFEAEQNRLERELRTDMLAARLENSRVLRRLSIKQKEFDRAAKTMSEDKRIAAQKELKQLEAEAQKEIMREEKRLNNMYGNASTSTQLASQKFGYKMGQDREKKQGERLGLGSLLVEIGSNPDASSKQVSLPAGRQIEKFPNALNALPADIRTAISEAIGLLKSSEGTSFMGKIFNSGDREKAQKAVKEIGEAISSGKPIISGKNAGKDRKKYRDAGYVIINI